VTQKLDIIQSLKIASKHHQHGRLKEAERIYLRILKINPNQPDALHLLGILATRTGEPDVAVELIGRAIGLRPNSAEFYDNLADAFAALGRYDEAIAARRKAISLDKGLFRAYLLLGNLLGDVGRFEEAIATYRGALQIKPNDHEVRNNLGFAYLVSDRLDEAFAELNEAARLRPNAPQIEMNLGHALVACAKHEEAMACFNRALAVGPLGPEWGSSRVMAMHYDPAYDSAAILKAARQWDESIAAPLRPSLRPHRNDRAPDRKLRIGYVSPDLRHHVVGQSLLPLLSYHDSGQFEIYCYASMPREDALTSSLREGADVWRNIHRISDDKAAEMIRADRIDILVDLALHSRGNRLAVFARKPAPVQVAYLGYCSTTGLEAMDYRLSDPYVDPKEVDLSDYSEKTIRLPQTFICYEPLQETPDVSPLPARSSGNITFGCMNNFSKCSPTALDLWARILGESPRSRLVLHAKPGSYLDQVRERFDRAGVSPERLEFVGRQDWPLYLQTISRMDIALDPFPYNGGITTCDSLWMGVPVITLSGKTAVGRVGRSILSNLGLTELIAPTPDEYVRIALDLANDLDRLAKLRAELRPRMLGSPLKNPRQLTQDLEAALRKAWRTYCVSPAVAENSAS
jgi:predicted O-linked N-acetylglucosamine transferase (SPINDLY family)